MTVALNVIAFDFGTSLVAGGNGIDGVTSFDTSTTLLGGDAPSTDDDWARWSRCSGRATSSVSPSWIIPSAALQDAQGAPWPGTPNDTTTVYDEEANPWAFALFWHATGVNQAEYKFIVSRADSRIESSVGTFLFNAAGKLQHADRASAIRLPLVDGSPGPALILQTGQTVDEGAPFTDIFVGPNDESFYANQDGAPSSAQWP